jgi:D-glycero-D-manno-heptose 1,7-bisphosphate phosphatase
MRPVVFLDRDGTINEEIGYITKITDLQLIAGAGQAIKRLNDANIAAILITNQTGAARGYYDETHIQALNNRLVSLLKAESAHLDALYYCPHLADGIIPYLSIKCDCRKPEPGLVLQAYKDNSDLDSQRAYVVGDKATDVELAHNCNAKGILVKTGYGNDVLQGKYQHPVTADFTAENIIEAIDWIIRDLSKN